MWVMFCHLEYKPEENPSVGMDYPGRMETKTTGWCDMISTCSTNMERFVWIDFDIWCPVISLTMSFTVSLDTHGTLPQLHQCLLHLVHRQRIISKSVGQEWQMQRLRLLSSKSWELWKYSHRKEPTRAFLTGLTWIRKRTSFILAAKVESGNDLNQKKWIDEIEELQTKRNKHRVCPMTPRNSLKLPLDAFYGATQVSKSSATRSTWATSSSARNPANHIQNRLNTSFFKVECLRQ